MDGRKKSIAELRLRVAEYRRELERATGDLGRFLLTRVDPPPGDKAFAAEHRRLLRDLDDSEAAIRAVVGDKDRLDINIRNQRLIEKNLDSLRRGGEMPFAGIGEVIMNSSRNADAGLETFIQRADAVLIRIKESEAAIIAVDADATADSALARLGRGARKALLRTALNSRLAELRRLYAECGQTYIIRTNFPAVEPAAELVDSQSSEAWALLRVHLRSVETETRRLDDLKREEAELRDNLALKVIDGNVRRSVVRLEKRLEEDHRRLNALYVEVGERACGFKSMIEGPAKTEAPESAAQTAGGISLATDDSLKVGEAAALSAKIKAFRESIDTAQYQVEKLESSLRLDKAVTELRSLTFTLSEVDRRIEQGKLDKADCEQRIVAKRAEIEALKREQPR